jgi:hypothetical protein
MVSQVGNDVNSPKVLALTCHVVERVEQGEDLKRDNRSAKQYLVK